MTEVCDTLSYLAMAEGFPKLGGHDCKFIETVSDELICLICMFVAKNPRQLICCGKLFCTDCLEGLGEDQPCPHCREEEWDSFPDKRSKTTTQLLSLDLILI